MAITIVEIRAVLREIAPALVGGWIQRIGEPMPDILVFDVRVPGRTLRLLISIDPDHARLHLATRRHPNPPAPPPFCQFLRARLLGARIDRICQVNDDRIVRLACTAGGGAWSLVAELLGRQADLVLIDGEDQVITTYRRAENRIGRRYSPPPRGGTQPAVPAPCPATPLNADAPFPVSAELEER